MDNFFLFFADTKELSDIKTRCISHYHWNEDPFGTPTFPIPKNVVFHINGVALKCDFHLYMELVMGYLSILHLRVV